jgi:hypothetical protein
MIWRSEKEFRGAEVRFICGNRLIVASEDVGRGPYNDQSFGKCEAIVFAQKKQEMMGLFYSHGKFRLELINSESIEMFLGSICGVILETPWKNRRFVMGAKPRVGESNPISELIDRMLLRTKTMNPNSEFLMATSPLVKNLPDTKGVTFDFEWVVFSQTKDLFEWNTDSYFPVEEFVSIL